MAPKNKQLLLSFAPRAAVPEKRSEGAVVVPRVDATLPPPNDQIAMGLEPSPAKKPNVGSGFIVVVLPPTVPENVQCADPGQSLVAQCVTMVRPTDIHGVPRFVYTFPLDLALWKI